MINWLITQVNWLIDTVSAAYDWIVEFIQNPYPTLRSLFDWAYARAVQFIEAVKKEIADWTWQLYLDALKGISWVLDFINKNILPVVYQLLAFISKFTAEIYWLVKPIIDNALAGIITLVQNALSLATYALQLVFAIQAAIMGWVISQLAGLLSDIATLKQKFGAVDFGNIIKQVGELYLFNSKIGETITYYVLQGLLDWLEDKLGEALE